MRNIHCEDIAQAVDVLYADACCDLPADVERLILAAAQSESQPIAQGILYELCENARIARELGMPCCQDTGMAVVFADMGADLIIQGGTLQQAVDEGVRRAAKRVPLRASVLDPLSRENTRDNTPAVLHLRQVEGDALHITVMPKGFGSENMGAVRMLKPSDGLPGLINFVVDQVKRAGGNPCPPLVVGVGVGGTMEMAALLSKRALLRTVGDPQPDARLAELEAELLKRINALNVGPMGLGGDTTALAVHALAYPTHIAGLPVGVSLCCNAARHKEVTL